MISSTAARAMLGGKKRISPNTPVDHVAWCFMMQLPPFCLGPCFLANALFRRLSQGASAGQPELVWCVYFFQYFDIDGMQLNVCA